MKITLKRLALGLASAGLLTIYGCGGGSSTTADPVPPTSPVPPSTMLSGTVAGGAAVIGNVIVTDSKGATKGATIEANGHYTIDVSGMTGPFMLKAAGTVGNTTVTYYSAATDADLGATVNVTPFTNMIVSNIAAQMAETYFSDPANIAKIGTLITPAKLAAAQTSLHAKLQPVLAALGLSDSIDLLRTSFAADHSGMDAVLDLVKVEVDTATNVVTLKNALTNIAIATDDVSKSSDDAIAVDGTKITEITKDAATDLQTVVAKLNSFAALFATGLPDVATLTNSGVFDTSASFMMSGQTFAQFASELSTEPDAVGLKFSNVDVSPVVGSPEILILSAVITSNTDTFADKIRLKMVKVAGVWLVQGDGRKADISIRAQAALNYWTTLNSSLTTQGSGSNLQSGLNLGIDPFAYNSNHTNNPIVSALVTGPGLGNGVTLVQDIQNRWLKVEGLPYSTNLIPECAGQVTTQCVNIAATADNGEYNLVLKNSSNASLNGTGYTLKLAKKPYLTSDLTTSMFPAITSITIDGQDLTPSSLVAGKTVSVSWTMPAGIKPKYANIWAFDSTGANYFKVEKELTPTMTSALFGLGTPNTSGTPTQAGTWLEGVDLFGRRLAVSQHVSIQ